MSNERDELVEIIQDCGEYIPGSHADDYVSPDKAADAILAKYVVIPKALQDSINRVIETHMAAPRMKRLDQIRERLANATPGPWVHDEEGFLGCGQVYTMGEGVEMGNIAAPSGDLYARSGYSPKDDMILIAAAPTDITALLAAVEGVLAYGADREKYTDELDPEAAKAMKSYAYHVRRIIDTALEGK